MLAAPPQLDSVLSSALAQVESIFQRQLRSDLPAVARLCDHVENYRGKMLRPTLVLLCGLASASPLRPSVPSSLSSSHLTAAAVVEMIHMATLVHDDVLDEADTRRRADSINRLHGNETAVILGDYLIAASYHLCSQLNSPQISLLVARASMTLCEGELLQLSQRDSFSLDEATYFEIIERKTAALVALSCRLGATCSGADEADVARLEAFGRKLGQAFQIQDDLLDLTGRQASLGKPVGKDLEKGKLTLPLIHHLASIPPKDRGRSLILLEQACSRSGAASASGSDAAACLLRSLEDSGSVAHARAIAESLIAESKAELVPIAPSPAKSFLESMADAAITRSS